MENSIYLGVDISKSFFDVSGLKEGKAYHLKLDNTLSGFNTLLESLPLDSHVVMEASGPYHLQLATFLYDNKIKVSVVNPLVIKRFAKCALAVPRPTARMRL